MCLQVCVQYGMVLCSVMQTYMHYKHTKYCMLSKWAFTALLNVRNDIKLSLGACFALYLTWQDF